MKFTSLIIAGALLLAAFATLGEARSPISCRPQGMRIVDGSSILAEVNTFSDADLAQAVTLSSGPSTSTELAMSLGDITPAAVVQVRLNDQLIQTFAGVSDSYEVPLALMHTPCGSSNTMMVSISDSFAQGYGSIACHMNWQLTISNPAC